MAQLSHLIHVHGVLLVFGTVLLAQAGLPIPAFPVLVIAGALAVEEGANWPLFLAASVLACLISDYCWFRAGRQYGKRILRLLCKISLSPDSCVSQTEDNFSRWGAKSLVVAKFIPGFNTVAPPLAGALGVTAAQFMWLSTAGALVWSGAGMALGAWFHDSVDGVIARFQALGATALSVVGGLLALFVLLKYVERKRNLGAAEVPRVTTEELKAMLAAGHDPLIVDARSATGRQLEGAGIPGALAYDAATHAHLLATLDRGRHIVVYCACPSDITAARVARRFVKSGFHRARALHGGLDAWHGADATVPAAIPVARPG